MAKSSKANSGKKSTGKRTLIAPKGDKRFVKRDAQGQFKESDDVSKSLSQDSKRKSTNKVKPGYGDQGDRQTKPTGNKKANTKKVGTKNAATKKVATKKAATKKAAAKGASTKKAATKKAATKKAATKKSATKKSATKK